MLGPHFFFRSPSKELLRFAHSAVDKYDCGQESLQQFANMQLNRSLLSECAYLSDQQASCYFVPCSFDY